MKNKKLILGLLFFILFIFLFKTAHEEISKGSSKFEETFSLKKFLPVGLKEALKNTVFVHSQLNATKKNNEELKILVKQKEYLIKQKDFRIKNIYSGKLNHKNLNLDKISFNFVNEYELHKFEEGTLKLKVFQSDFLFDAKNYGAIASAYIDQHKNDILLSTGNQFYFFDIQEFENENFLSKQIPSNIDLFLKNFNSLEKSSLAGFGVRDIAIIDNNLYLSYTNELKENCFNTSIIIAKFETDYLKFKNFFEPDECVDRENIYGLFTPYISGGRIANYSKDTILLTTGSFQFRSLAQEKNNVFGKILSINKINQKYEVISLGHRNPQGLYFDKFNNVIISTEHGPMGGDEININISPNKVVKNFGWPISSYGFHYKDHPSNVSAPLHKSHSDHGFVEPIHYFTPSIGISELIKIPKKFLNSDNNNFFVTSLGNDVRDGDMSIHLFKFDKKYKKILEKETINIFERIRDIKYIEKLNSSLAWLESSGSLGLIFIE